MATSTAVLDSGLATSKMILDGEFEKIDFRGELRDGHLVTKRNSRGSGGNRWYPCGNIRPGNRWHPREVQQNCNRRLGTHAVSGDLRKVLRGSLTFFNIFRHNTSKTVPGLLTDSQLLP